MASKQEYIRAFVKRVTSDPAFADEVKSAAKQYIESGDSSHYQKLQGVVAMSAADLHTLGENNLLMGCTGTTTTTTSAACTSTLITTTLGC